MQDISNAYSIADLKGNLPIVTVVGNLDQVQSETILFGNRLVEYLTMNGQRVKVVRGLPEGIRPNASADVLSALSLIHRLQLTEDLDAVVIVDGFWVFERQTLYDMFRNDHLLEDILEMLNKVKINFAWLLTGRQSLPPIMLHRYGQRDPVPNKITSISRMIGDVVNDLGVSFLLTNRQPTPSSDSAQPSEESEEPVDLIPRPLAPED